MQHTKIVSFVSFFLFALSTLLPAEALALKPALPIKNAAYRAAFVSQSIADPIVLTTHETKTVVIRLKNTGTETWRASGTNVVSAYTVEPKYRASSVATSAWQSASQTPGIKKDTKPGEIAELSIPLLPKKAGTYKEEFFLAAENATWIDGGYFYLDILVKDAPFAQEKKVSEPVLKTAATFIMSRPTAVYVEGGQDKRLLIRYQNTGDTTWDSYGLVLETPKTAGIFSDERWVSAHVLANTQKAILPTAYAKSEIYIRGPVKKGTYTLMLALTVNGKKISGSSFEIPVIVGKDAPADYVAPSLPEDEVSPSLRFDREPTIRVGLWEPKKSTTAKALTDEYIVFAGTTEKGVLAKGQSATFSESGAEAMFESSNLSFSTSAPIRLVPKNDPHAVFQLPEFERTISWKKGSNFNQYRGTLEFVRGKKDNTMWMVNELLLDDYVSGVAETGNDSPFEYQKALQTAARTYAFTVAACKCKYGVFDVTATTADQLYLGYVSEVASPNLAKATYETRGYMVTHGNEIVITPYFSQTDGMTRLWSQAWGGKDKPWLVPVEATYDKRDGVKMWGHGVGMSNRDAMIRAKEEGVLWDALLQYYYTGVAVERVY